MTDNAPSRRRFLQAAAAAGVTAGLGRAAAPAGKVLVRRDIASLDPNGPEIASLRRGFAVMKARPASDPTSFIFQANIHLTRDLPAARGWNQCPHGNYFFAPWHRMYTYWFERLLRAAAGDPTLTVPYWNPASPASRTLPVAFRLPADASNPLYLAERNTDAGGVNAGAVFPPSAAATTWVAMATTVYSSPGGTNAGFGGAAKRQSSPYFGQIEGWHNLIHVLLGGTTGYMSDPFMSGREPIFWPHHANVDRLWKRWLDQGNGRANPTHDRAWMDATFDFVDENGRAVKMAVRDALDTEAQLGYRYDDDPPPVAHPVGVAPPRPAPLPDAVTAEAKVPRTALGTDGPVSVTVEFGAAREAIGKAAASGAAMVLLAVEGIRFPAEPPVYYETYLNLPAGAEADYQGVHYAGNLVFAGLGPHLHGDGLPPGVSEYTDAEAKLAEEEGECPPGGRRTFDVTDLVRTLHARGLWDADRLRVTFVMRGLIPVNGAGVTTPGEKCRFDKVSLKVT